MSADARRSALDELIRARPALDGIQAGGAPADLAAQIVAAWGAIEVSLRALLESDSLSGQSLIREARIRQVIGFDQANALAELDAVRDRAVQPGYRPTDADVLAARSAFRELEMALRIEKTGARAPASPALAAEPLPTLEGPVFSPPAAGRQPKRAGRSPWRLVGLVVAMVVVVGSVGAYFAFRGTTDSRSLEDGIQFYAKGQREAAAGAFAMAARQNPKDPRPHVYLARMAREAGNLTLANDELQLALQADPQNAIARREMAAYLLAAGNNELAVKFYAYALESDSTDKVAMGWLACALTRLNRLAEAQRWTVRAGTGDWSGCTSTPPAAPPPGRAGSPLPRQP